MGLREEWPHVALAFDTKAQRAMSRSCWLPTFLSAVLLGAAASGCRDETPPGPPAPAALASGAPPASSARAPTAAAPPSSVRGGALAQAPGGRALYVADEDHGMVRVVPLPLSTDAVIRDVPLPGPPAQVAVVGERVLVTVRTPGLLLVMKPDDERGLVETGRVEVPADAWGVASDGALAVVTSAWTHQVSAVDLSSLEKRWTVDVAREPRGAVITRDGRAYISHLVGPSLTQIDSVGASTPAVSAVELPAAALRAPSGRRLHASLGYSLVLSPDERRLYVPRHGLGALGIPAWFGAATVDVLLTAGNEPLAPSHLGGAKMIKTSITSDVWVPSENGFVKQTFELPGSELAGVPASDVTPFVQPRDVVYRKRTNTLLVASEGTDLVVELDALAVDPSLQPLETYQVGEGYKPMMQVATACGAPTGLVLSADEKKAWVFCRSTYDLAEIDLFDRPGVGPATTREPSPLTSHIDRPVRVASRLPVGADPLGEAEAIGRRLFYNAIDFTVSGGLACAGCHPEGRDDGHVWHESRIREGSDVVFLGSAENDPTVFTTPGQNRSGHPRQTPMLAGRLQNRGSFGWKAEHPDLISRVAHGFLLHRWVPDWGSQNPVQRIDRLVRFLSKGLVPPPREDRELTELEKRGRELFLSPKTECSSCHEPSTEYSDRQARTLASLPLRPGFVEEEDPKFRTPPLLFVGGTPPYLHDGSAATLEDLIDGNRDRMGKTNHLSKEDRAALVAFLRTL